VVPPGSRPRSLPPVKRTDSTIRRAFLRFVAAVRSQQLPERVFRRRSGCPPLASRTIRLSAFERQATNETRILQPGYDARARPTELETLSRAGAVARFALRRFDPPGEPRRSNAAVRSVPCDTPHPFTRFCAFEDRTGSRSRYEPRRTGQGATPRVAPKVLRSSTEPTTCSRRTVLRRPAAPSWRATWAEACEQLLLAARRSRARPLLKGVERRGIPSSREAPNTLCHQPGCVIGWSAEHGLAA
jgi:hypothetical protein